MGAPDKWKQVMFAKAVKLDVAHNHHFIIRNVEDRIIDQFLRINVIACQQFGIHARHTPRRVLQTLPFRILSDGAQQCQRGGFDRR